MHTYRIQVKGIVQGVGFRPFICRLAVQLKITGEVKNTTEGVRILCTTDSNNLKRFISEIQFNPPVNSTITSLTYSEAPFQLFNGFKMTESSDVKCPDILITPDLAICDTCKTEVENQTNRRYRYAFTTCVNCGPRYSIQTHIPFDRPNTSMQFLGLCHSCETEFESPNNQRFLSQTTSCPQCSIPIHLHGSEGNRISSDPDYILDFVSRKLLSDEIIAVKSTGGYLLLANSTSNQAVSTLRKRKHRPTKPFAVLFQNLEAACKEVVISPREAALLTGSASPIVLCRNREKSVYGLVTNLIAPGMVKTGVMLPNNPLLLLLAKDAGVPLIATSANISGCPVIYKDADAIKNLKGIADYILTYDREIITPEDDSVVQLTETGNTIMLRRGRGYAPSLFTVNFSAENNSILAMGAELKSTFTLSFKGNTFVSQYLGNHTHFETQETYKETLDHLLKLTGIKPSCILTDLHPGYYVSKTGRELARNLNLPWFEIQHHKAHFGSVLAENNLLDSENILGIIWDGTGYGEDGQIWGGETFLLKDKRMERMGFVTGFPQILGDKMSREPRLSALSLLHNHPDKEFLTQPFFTDTEWDFYNKVVKNSPVKTSSIGRLTDGVASVLGFCQVNSYEGEAAMLLEAAASRYSSNTEYYSIDYNGGEFRLNRLMDELITDYLENPDSGLIAHKYLLSLAELVGKMADFHSVNKIAFSGGVFQNALLTDLIISRFSDRFNLYFHKELSPNDECISLGQAACYLLGQPAEITHKENQLSSVYSILNH